MTTSETLASDLRRVARKSLDRELAELALKLADEYLIIVAQSLKEEQAIHDLVKLLDGLVDKKPYGVKNGTAIESIGDSGQ